MMATDETDRRWPGSGAKRGSGPRVLRVILIALLLAFLFGLVVGTLLRQRLDEPVRYIGALEAKPIRSPTPGSVPLAPHPGDVGYALPRILMARDDEEQIAQPVQVTKRALLHRLAWLGGESDDGPLGPTTHGPGHVEGGGGGRAAG